MFDDLISWFSDTFLGWLWDMMSTGLAWLLTLLEFGFWQIATWVLALAEEFVVYMTDETGMIPTLSFDALPEDALLLLAWMEVPTAISIMLAGLGVRFVRKALLRF